jgi:hypothetical protein
MNLWNRYKKTHPGVGCSAGESVLWPAKTPGAGAIANTRKGAACRADSKIA